MFSHNERRDSSGSDDQTPVKQTQRFAPANTNVSLPRPGQHLDDADLLAWKHQYMNIGLREQSVLSNSAEDLRQLVDHVPFQGFGQDYNDIDDEELHFDNGNTYDYETSIQERLKKANEDLQQDETPAKLRHNQRVSFDAIVKAVDIDQDPQELANSNLLAKPPISPVIGETSIDSTNSPIENAAHEYTVPLNDTQPKEGPTLTEKIKEMQFHGVPMTGERWLSTTSHPMNDSVTGEEDLSLTKSSSNNNSDIQEPSDMTNKSSLPSQKSMVVSINGGFEIQNEDDYTAKGQTRTPNDVRKTSVGSSRNIFAPTPPTEAKQRLDPLKPPPPPRPYPSATRPQSSDNSRQTYTSHNSISKSWADNNNRSATGNSQRAKSAGVSKSLEPYTMKYSSGVDFDALERKAMAAKREKEQAERRKQKEAEAQRKIQLEKAKEAFEQWVQDKDTERKRLSEEKRLEKEEHDARETQCAKELSELREQKYQKWVERKNREVMMANEFRKLQADDEAMASGGGSSSSLPQSARRENHRAFHRWLRQKYEQSKEEQRQLRLESRRLRRRQRRSIKRFRLQQDLQLARSFGYS